MSILSRYILRQHIGPFIFSFSIISLLWILNLLFKEFNRFLSKGLPLNVILEFFVLSLGWIVALAVPMATLTASLMVYGRMSADNEITAIKSSGISFFRIFAPTFVAAILLALGLVWFNNNVLPHSNHRLRNLMTYMGNKKPAMRIEPGVWYDDLPNFTLLVSSLRDSSDVALVEDVMINDYSELNTTATINAEHGAIVPDETTGFLEMHLFDGEMQKINVKKPEEFTSITFEKHILRVNVAEMFDTPRRRSQSRGDREKSVQQMQMEVKEKRAENQQRLLSIEQKTGEQFKKVFGSTLGLSEVQKDSTQKNKNTNTPRARIPDATNIQDNPRDIYRNRQQIQASTNSIEQQLYLDHKKLVGQLKIDYNVIKSNFKRNNQLLVEIHKKYSIPFACILFVLIGMTLGTIARSGGMGMSLGISLFFFILHWALLISGEDLADRGLFSPFLSMWLANIIVGIAGLIMLFIITTESRLAQFLKEKGLKLLLIGFLVEWIRRMVDKRKNAEMAA